MYRCIGMKQADIVAKIARETGFTLPEAALPEIWAETERQIRCGMNPTPGIEAFIRTLACNFCVASSSAPERIELSLKMANLLGLFGQNHIFSTSMVARGKPAPDIFLFAAERLKADPANCVVIEDSPFGVQAAVAAGMAVFGYAGASHTHDQHQADLLRAGASACFDSWSRLPGLLAASNLALPQASRGS
jgi:HAD superfamily hydrolase (TIGR01509 family)